MVVARAGGVRSGVGPRNGNPVSSEADSPLPDWWEREVGAQRDQLEEARVYGWHAGRCRLVGSRLLGEG